MRRRLAVTLIAAMLAALVPTATAIASQHLQIVYLNTGNGDTALFRGPCGEVGLVDANRGADDEVLALLDEWDAREDLVWMSLSHYHVDHFGAVADIGTATGTGVDAVYDRGGDATAADSQTYAAYHAWVTGAGVRQPVDIGDTFDLCGTVTFDVVSAGTDGTAADGVAVSDENDRSVCLDISYGQFDLASCGDAHDDVETAVADDIGQVEAVKVSHHGSTTSSSPVYIDTLDPQVAIFNVGANSYGHPDAGVTADWQNAGATVFRTGNADGSVADGDITVTAQTDGSFAVAGDTGRTYTSDDTAPPAATPDPQSIAPTCADTTTGRFPDSGGTHERSIECIGWWGVTAGNRDGTYGPAGTVTRDQMASFVARTIMLTGGSLSNSPADAFTDDKGNTHEGAINQLADAGIIGGVGGGRYNPSGTVNRAQMATFLARAWEDRTGSALPAGVDYFADDDGGTHETNINAVAAAGLTGGTSDGYNPGGAVTRAQMATFLARFMAKLVADGHAAYPPRDPQPLPEREPEPAPENPWDAESCDPAYDPCVPPVGEVGDLDCADIREHYSNGVTVDHTHGDPHRLDQDADGIACE